MSRPIAHERSLSQHPAIYEPNTRNDVPVTLCTVISALAKIITDYVTALFQYLASFFTGNPSDSAPVSGRASLVPDSHGANIEFLHAVFLNQYLTSYLNSTDREELLQDIPRKLVYSLVANPSINSRPIPSFARCSMTCAVDTEISIEALRHSYNQLDPFDRRYIRIKFNNSEKLTIINHTGDDFVLQAYALAEHISANPGFVDLVTQALDSYTA